MRAKTPLDEIQHLGDPVALPVPLYSVGTRIDPQRLDAESLEYYAKTVLKEIIKESQTIIYSLKKQGYMTGMSGKKMLPENKAQIREKLDVMRNAHTVELAGYKPCAMQATGAVANQCYLRQGQCHGGVNYDYYLLFRCRLAGNEVVYIHTGPVIQECYIDKLLCTPSTSKGTL